MSDNQLDPDARGNNPFELYVTEIGPNAGSHVSEDFDTLPEGTRVAIYRFSSMATVKIRREALLIDSQDKVLKIINLDTGKLTLPA